MPKNNKPETKTVKHTFPADVMNGTSVISIRHNGIKKKFPRGVECEVPLPYYLIYVNSMASSNEAMKYVADQRKKAKNKIV